MFQGSSLTVSLMTFRNTVKPHQIRIPVKEKYLELQPFYWEGVCLVSSPRCFVKEMMAHSLDFIITPVITNLRLLNQITIDITERNEKLVLLRPRGDEQAGSLDKLTVSWRRDLPEPRPAAPARSRLLFTCILRVQFRKEEKK